MNLVHLRGHQERNHFSNIPYQPTVAQGHYCKQCCRSVFANTLILKALHLFDGYIKVREEACIDFSPVFYSEAGHPKHENICIYLFFSTISSYLKTSYITIVSVESIAVVRPEGWSPSAKRSLELFGHSQREMVVVLCG